MSAELPTPSQQVRAFRVKDFCSCYGIGKTKFYEEVAFGRLKVFKIGRRTLVSREAAGNWLARAQQVGQVQFNER